MLKDEITQYTNDKNILDMYDFTNTEKESDEYMDAQATVVETIHNALRVARWAKLYKGVQLDLDDICNLRRELDDLKKAEF